MSDTDAGTVSQRATSTFTVTGPCERKIDPNSVWLEAEQDGGRRPTSTTSKVN